MAGGLNDLELETLEEVNLSDSPQLAARPPPAVPARRARRIVSGVALGVTLTLALITWVSLRVDTPPKARAAPDLVSTPPAAVDVPEIITPRAGASAAAAARRGGPACRGASRRRRIDLRSR